MTRSISSIFIIGVTGFVFTGIILSNADHDLAFSLEGLRCDSCGRECSIVCGSRQFRTCCFNYIKKRSDTSLKVSPSPSGQSEPRGLSSLLLSPLSQYDTSDSSHMHEHDLYDDSSLLGVGRMINQARRSNSDDVDLQDASGYNENQQLLLSQLPQRLIRQLVNQKKLHISI